MIKIVYQKYLALSTIEDCAPSIWNRAHIPGLRVFRLKLRGDIIITHRLTKADNLKNKTTSIRLFIFPSVLLS